MQRDRIRAMFICYNRFPRTFSSTILRMWKQVCHYRFVNEFAIFCWIVIILSGWKRVPDWKKSNFPNLFKSTPSSQSATKRAFNEVIEIKSLTGEIGTRQITLCNANWILLVHVTGMSSPRLWEVHAIPVYKTYRMPESESVLHPQKGKSRVKLLAPISYRSGNVGYKVVRLSWTKLLMQQA